MFLLEMDLRLLDVCLFQLVMLMSLSLVPAASFHLSGRQILDPDVFWLFL